MKATVHIPCPYCKIENKLTVELTSTIMAQQLIYCDEEQGGCARPFMLRLMADVQARTSIIGEEKILGSVSFPNRESIKNVIDML